MSQYTLLRGLLWLILNLILLLVFQRQLHHEIQAFLLILTRRLGVTQVIFAIIFLPGVFLHEISHFVMAKLLGIKTGRISFVPQMKQDGHLRLGYVETNSGGILRDALIGIAPLIAGCASIALIATNKLNVLPLWAVGQLGDWITFWDELGLIMQRPDFWLWFYLTFTISSMMLPSASDRQAWWPVILLCAVLFGFAIVAGAGNWLIEYISPAMTEIFVSLAMVFGLSYLVHASLLLPFWLGHKVLSKVTHMDVE